jgi:hypothetical protein
MQAATILAVVREKTFFDYLLMALALSCGAALTKWFQTLRAKFEAALARRGIQSPKVWTGTVCATSLVALLALLLLWWRADYQQFAARAGADLLSSPPPPIASDAVPVIVAVTLAVCVGVFVVLGIRWNAAGQRNQRAYPPPMPPRR